MTKRASFLPVVLVLIIAVLAIIAIASGRSNAPNVTANDAYPHHICTFERYCAGNACTRERISFVAYLTSETGEPRIEIPGTTTRATLERTPSGLEFATIGGELQGTLSIFNDRALDWTAASGSGDSLVEHFASGGCERLQEP